MQLEHLHSISMDLSMQRWTRHGWADSCMVSKTRIGASCMAPEGRWLRAHAQIA